MALYVEHIRRQLEAMEPPTHWSLTHPPRVLLPPGSYRRSEYASKPLREALCPVCIKASEKIEQERKSA